MHNDSHISCDEHSRLLKLEQQYENIQAKAKSEIDATGQLKKQTESLRKQKQELEKLVVERDKDIVKITIECLTLKKQIKSLKSSTSQIKERLPLHMEYASGSPQKGRKFSEDYSKKDILPEEYNKKGTLPEKVVGHLGTCGIKILQKKPAGSNIPDIPRSNSPSLRILQNEIKELRNSNQNLEKKVVSLQKEIIQKQQIIAKVEDIYKSDLQKEMRNFRKEMELADETSKAYKQDVASLQKKIKELTEELNQKSASRPENLNGNVHQLIRQISTKQKQCQKLSQELQTQTKDSLKEFRGILNEIIELVKPYISLQQFPVLRKEILKRYISTSQKLSKQKKA